MSSSSPEEEDRVVAVKFLGPQLSICKPAQSNSKWINIRISNPCFFSSPVMYSEKEDMFCIVGSGGHLVGSWDLVDILALVLCSWLGLSNLLLRPASLPLSVLYSVLHSLSLSFFTCVTMS
ncbi:hypothetical protein Bca52824_035685 [Brassica carinata]|uniref:Uncharacterized protein n=1 Tax=Brassica carinata TaxID=52824 RepID=A0A8X7S156_BRACI|nr:hypothetical protein Bca52824_035685 [Brassica carinata]